MDLRPDWCNDLRCRWLNGFAGRICIGVMPHKEEHPKSGIFNNLYLCFQGVDPMKVNAADLAFLGECAISGIKEVIEEGLYNPCQECGIDDPVKRLQFLLAQIGQKP